MLFCMGNGEKISSLADFKRESGESLAQLISDLNFHNKRHGPGAKTGKMVGRFLSKMVDRQSPDEPEPDITSAEVDVDLESAREARTVLGEIQGQHGKVLERFGLRLAHQQDASLRAGVPSGPIQMRVANAHALITYLRSLQAGVLSENVKESLQTLVESIERQVAHTHLENPLPEEKGMLENLDSIVDVFKKLKDAVRIQRLEHYALFHRTNRLPQYLETEREGLWQQPGEGFGPADWVKDISREGLEQKWKSALSVLRSQETLGDTGVSKELRDHLLTCVKSARETIKTTSLSEYVQKEFEKTLTKYEKELTHAL